MAQYFIRHPLQAVVGAILLTLLGILAVIRLPIEEYPNMNQPTVSVSTSYPGADSQVLQDTVAKIIENEIRGIEGIDSLSSFSDSSGSYQLNVTFDYGINGDIATVNVQNRLQAILPQLPQAVQSEGIQVTRNTRDTIFVMALCSPNGTYDSVYLQNYAKSYFLDRIKRVSGVGGVDEYTEDYAMRIWLQPDKMAARGITVSDVSNAIEEQNVRPAVGSLGKLPTTDVQEKQLIGRVMNTKKTPADFEKIILQSENGATTRLRDVARISEGVRDTRYLSYVDGQPAAAYGITLADNANALETINKVRDILEEAEGAFPPDMECRIVVDRTKYISESMQEVSYTFFEALLLVMVIMFLFLQNRGATIISIIAIPVSLIATFIAFKLLGFTLNLLTLFALILAIGLVVDDAIVVVESVMQERERGILDIKEATRAAMGVVQKPVVAIAFVLLAVFLPVAFFDGMTGILYRQFALTIAVSMGISAVVALSLTPALCVLILPIWNDKVENSKILAGFQNYFRSCQQKYLKVLGWCIRRTRTILVGLAIMTVGIILCYRLLPTEYIPGEDQGYFMVGLNLTEGTSMNRTADAINRLTENMLQYEAIENIVGIAGSDLLSDTTKPNAGIMFVALKDWSERKDLGIAPDDIVDAANEAIEKAVPEAHGLVAAPFLSRDISMQIMDVSGHTDEELNDLATALYLEAQKHEELDEVEIGFSINTPYADFTVNEDLAKELKVNISDIYTTMEAMFGGEEVNDFTRYGQVYKTVIQADRGYRETEEDLRYLFVRSEDGEMVPISSLVHSSKGVGPGYISRYNGVRSIQVNVTAADGYSSGEAMDALEEAAGKVIGTGFRMAWSKDSLQEKKAQREVIYILALGILFVFLCLVALYESWSLPVAVLLSVPLGIGGTLLGVAVADKPISIFVQIGILLIVGLTVKNAILIVEYAKLRVDNGMAPLRAVMTAAKLRFRPIIMTSFAFVVGCLPLAFADGAGSVSRCSMGVAVVGGMTVGTILGVFVIPLLFIMISRVYKGTAQG
ncbi:RND efflux system, inner membrane transporter CmeB [Anaerovibrio sp. JC8]|uniref:efflux RND transporter permease subunit n=1 Tax=Anaerovibrio sp. JC8 TaxID=1240085 RepID=UPI000A09A1B4|nr:efflux RND transporter permease subunit [Anaerovibrio sp. JC8]ORT99972.1 RND efflux system, inner membrane transporter CmeB [Anaerovibrio sp. JC8]